MSSRLRNHQRIARVSRQRTIDLLNEHPLTAIDPSKQDVKFDYDPRRDVAYLRLSRGKVAASQEVEPDLILDIGTAGQIVGVEFLRFARRFAAQFKQHPLRKTG